MENIVLMNETEIERALKRIAHEIIEGNNGAENLVLIGIKRRGVPLAKKIASLICDIESTEIPVGYLDITLYRDDLSQISPQPELHGSEVPFEINKTHLVMVDDVIYTGRTARAAMDAVMDLGRPSIIKLAVLIDRGHRELPIRGDYIGKNVPTSRTERIAVHMKEIDGENKVYLIREN